MLKGQKKWREREREREISVKKSMKLALVLGVYDLTTCGVFPGGGGVVGEEIKTEVQVFRRELHTHIHLD